MRNNGKNILRGYIQSEKNVGVIEKSIFTLFQKEESKTTERYLEILYKVCYLKKRGKPLKDILQDTREGNLGYSNDIFSEMYRKQKEKDDYLENPFEIEVGVVTCKKCGSDRTIASTKMDRASDEPLSVYAQCMKCKHKWRENN